MGRDDDGCAATFAAALSSGLLMGELRGERASGAGGADVLEATGVVRPLTTCICRSLLVFAFWRNDSAAEADLGATGDAWGLLLSMAYPGAASTKCPVSCIPLGTGGSGIFDRIGGGWAYDGGCVGRLEAA